ncbi:hypothetical protein ABK040_004439 [Willaertia magna]
MIKQIFGESSVTNLTKNNKLYFPELNPPLPQLKIPFHSEFLMLFGKVPWSSAKGCLQFFEISEIKKVIAGDNFFVILTQSGICYVSDTSDNENIPNLLKWTVDEPIEDVFGHSHVILLTKKGVLYVFENKTNFKNQTNGSHLCKKITKFQNEKIIGVDCGNDFYLVLTQNNNVYGFGTNYCGQLGTSDGAYDSKRSFKKANTSHIESKIIKVYCTYNTSIVLTEDGKCYACGDSSYSADGQLDASNSLDYRCVFKLIPNLEGEFIEKVIPGLFFVALKAKSGKYFVFGYNNYCQFGKSDTIPQDNVRGPKLLNTFDNNDIEEMECGGYNSTIVTKNRDVYISGFYSDSPFYPIATTTDGFINLNLKDYIQHEAFMPNSKMKLKLAMGRYFTALYTVIDTTKNVLNFRRSIKLNDIDLIVVSDEEVNECEFMDDTY